MNKLFYKLFGFLSLIYGISNYFIFSGLNSQLPENFMDYFFIIGYFFIIFFGFVLILLGIDVIQKGGKTDLLIKIVISLIIFEFMLFFPCLSLETHNSFSCAIYMGLLKYVMKLGFLALLIWMILDFEN